MSEFDLWKQELQDIDVPSFPKDEVTRIATNTEDPIRRSIRLQEHVNNLRPDLYASTLFRGISMLVNHHHATYRDQKLEMMFIGGIAAPEKDPIFRKRSSTDTIALKGVQFMSGSFASIHEIPYIARYTQQKTILGVKLYEPHFLNEDSEIQENSNLPDYLYVAVAAIRNYRFIE